MARPRTGLWIIGARGRLATTTLVGLAALQKRLVDSTGLVSALPYFVDLDFAAWDEIVVGGHDLHEKSITLMADELAADRILDSELVRSIRRLLQRFDKNICLGANVGVHAGTAEKLPVEMRDRREMPQEAVDRVQNDMREFVRRQKLERLIVVNLATEEPRGDEKSLPRRWSELARQLGQSRKSPIVSSSIYAIAALDAGYPYLNFTTSLGSKPVAIGELATERETCHMGQGANPAGNIVMSVLAPAASHLNLRVASWFAQRVTRSGQQSIAEPGQVCHSRVEDAGPVLANYLGYRPPATIAHSHPTADSHVELSCDHIQLQGFLSSPMSIQLTWQGNEAVWLVPAILDTVRFTAQAQLDGMVGPLKFLSCFFGEPLGVRQQDFARKYQMLLDWGRRERR